jgi:hypothetical protein
LIVLPLHGVGNKDGEGEPVNVLAYEIPKDPKMPWKHWSIDHSMHLTHNFDVVQNGKRELLYIGGKEGIKIMSFEKGKWSPMSNGEWFVQKESFGEVRVAAGNQNFVVGIQPMHGNELTVYSGKENLKRTVLTAALNQGHALATGDLLGQGRDQIVVGWREPDAHKKTGIKIFVSEDATNQWTDFWIDDSGMACEDLQLADLDGDGKKEIIAAGRATHNLKIYWNKN